MVDHPFTDAFAAGEKRSTLKLGVVVTFDVKGTATNAQITVPKGTSVSPAAQTCLINVAKQSRAPCSEQGGTAEATLTFSTYVVKNADAAPAK